MTVNLPISCCSDGDILAADIYNEFGVKIASCDTMLNIFILEKLTQFGIEKIQIYDPPVNQNSRAYNFKVLETGHTNSTLIVKEIIHDLSSGKILNVEKVEEASDIIYRHVNDDNDDNIIKCLFGIKNADEYTYIHSVNVAFYSMIIAKWLGLSEVEIKKVVQAGFLHDIGKSRIPLEILNKVSPLTKEEFNELKKHPVYGYYILEESNFFDIDIKRAVLLHHERINRTGYPFNISANSIGLIARIVSVADVYDAMTSDRVYKKKATPFDAFEMFLSEGYAIFDTYVTTEFVSRMAAYLTGSDVILNNGTRGKIVYVPPQNVLSPVICANGDYFGIKERGLKIYEML